MALHVSRLRLRAVRGLQNPGADFQRFMQRQGIAAMGGVSNPARISLQQRPPGFSRRRLIEQWRQHLHAHIRTALLPLNDGMFLAMILGHRGQLTNPLSKRPFDAPVRHIFWWCLVSILAS